MPRISNSSFKVNDSLEQQIELTSIDASVTIPISTSSPLDVTSNIAEVHGSAITLGQKTSANSFPVTLPSDQAGLNVTANIAEVQGLPLNLGTQVAAQSLPVTIASDTLPLEVTSNIALVQGAGISLGQKAKAQSFPVTLASDEDTLNINIESVSQTSLDFGQEPMVSSLPVVVASDQTAVASNIYYVDDNAKINSATTSSAFQVGNYGWDGSNWRQMNVSSGGNLKVESELEDHQGSEGNLANSLAYTDGDTSTAIDVSNHTLLTVFGDKTDTSNSIQPQVSADNSNWYNIDFQLYPDTGGNFFNNLNDIAINYFRLKFTGAGTCTATLLHNNH